MSAPITYIKDFLSQDADELFQRLSNELAWVRHGTVPRMEYYVNSVGTPYSYGVKEFARTYMPQPDHEAINEIRSRIEQITGTIFEVCFLNRYLNQSDHLGWHSDDSPEMDDDRPIAIVSLGVEREIMFRQKTQRPIVVNGNDLETLGAEAVGLAVERLLLEHSSLCLMAPGMQDTHQHRIPKSSRQCGERISLTFRGYIQNH